MMMPKWARKAKRAKKTSVVSRTTPASVVLRFPPDPALKHEKSPVAVLTKRYAVLKSWRAMALELKSNPGTLNKIVSTAKDDKPLLPSQKLINRMNEVYGCHLHYVPRVVTVAPLACGHAPQGKRCAICQPKSTRRYDGGVVRWNRVEPFAILALGCLYDSTVARSVCGAFGQSMR